MFKKYFIIILQCVAAIIFSFSLASLIMNIPEIRVDYIKVSILILISNCFKEIMGLLISAIIFVFSLIIDE